MVGVWFSFNFCLGKLKHCGCLTLFSQFQPFCATFPPSIPFFSWLFLDQVFQESISICGCMGAASEFFGQLMDTEIFPPKPAPTKASPPSRSKSPAPKRKWVVFDFTTENWRKLGKRLTSRRLDVMSVDFSRRTWDTIRWRKMEKHDCLLFTLVSPR